MTPPSVQLWLDPPPPLLPPPLAPPASAGPSAEYRSRAEFRPGLVGFSGLTKNAQKVELLVEGDRAALLYDSELPPPAGKLRIASFFWVAGGKIVRYDTRFDAEGFRKLLATMQR